MDAREQFIQTLYQTYAARLRRFCQHFVSYRSEYDGAVEECVQDVFVCAYRCYDELKDHPHVQAWLYKTCQYRMQDQIKRLRRHYAHTAGEDALEGRASPDTIERFIDESSARENVSRFFDSLDVRDRTLLQQRYLRGESIREIAGSLGMKESTVKVTLMRLRRRAQKFLSNSCIFSAILVTLMLFRSL